MEEDDLPISAMKHLAVKKNKKCKREREAILKYIPNSNASKLTAFILAMYKQSAFDISLISIRIKDIFNLNEFQQEQQNMYPAVLQCWKCNKNIHGAHLYLLQVRKKYFRAYYPRGCSHEDYDGTSWCSSCCTLIKVGKHIMIHCTGCAFLCWGKPTKAHTKYWCPNAGICAPPQWCDF
jgi:hypothetical protein